MQYISEFENQIANYFGSKYGVTTDCCTHAIELCLRLNNYNNLVIPNNTYISIPFTLMKLNIQFKFKDIYWEDYYQIENTNIYDSSVLWKKDSYVPNSFMCLSFQYKKHLNLGRGGMILLDNYQDYKKLKKMSYDGRDFDKPWKEQNISTIGYHYYMTPEIAKLGLEKFQEVKDIPSKKWSYKDYPCLSNMEVFNAI